MMLGQPSKIVWGQAVTCCCQCENGEPIGIQPWHILRIHQRMRMTMYTSGFLKADLHPINGNASREHWVFQKDKCVDTLLSDSLPSLCFAVNVGLICWYLGKPFATEHDLKQRYIEKWRWICGYSWRHRRHSYLVIWYCTCMSNPQCSLDNQHPHERFDVFSDQHV